MKYLPTLRSWMNALLFIFTTLSMIFCTKFVVNIVDFATYLIEIKNERIFIALCFFVFVITPILIYGYAHYILFGKAEYPRIGWLISGDSAIEGIWMFLVFLACLLSTFLILIGLNSPLLFFDPDQLREHGFSKLADQADRHTFWIGLLWLVLSAYLYHWRNLLTQKIKMWVNLTFKNRSK